MSDEILMSEGGGEPSGAPPIAETPENQPPAPQEGAQGAQPAQPPAQPGSSRLDGYRRMQTGYRGRMEARNRELRALKDERERLQGVLGSNNETMRGILETIRKQREGEGEQERPDPILQPEEHAAWMEARLAKMLDERLGPVVKDVETRREREEREAQERQEAEQQQAQAQEFLGHLESDAAAYEEMAPDLAAGATDRVASFRGLLADAFTDAYGDPQQGNHIANMFVRGVAIHARNMGQNMAAAVDAAVTGMIVRMGEAFGIPIEPDGPGGSEMGGGNGNGNGHQPAPQPQNNGGEIARLERVRQRARGAANAAPALPARDSAPAGRLQELVRAGVTDHRQLHRAALQDAHGNMMEAQRLLGSLLPGQA